MSRPITIFHGSKQVVEVPTFESGRRNNDFGLVFYCTESNESAKEWAVSSLHDGFSNRYTVDTEHLNTLNLNSPDHTILNWIAVLVGHRVFSIRTPIARRARRYLIEHFGIKVDACDLICGYRADDSLSLLRRGISEQPRSRSSSYHTPCALERRGEQIVLKSRFAFSNIRFEGFEVARKNEFCALRKARNADANQTYLDIQVEEVDGLYMQDILRGGRLHHRGPAREIGPLRTPGR